MNLFAESAAGNSSGKLKFDGFPFYNSKIYIEECIQSNSMTSLHVIILQKILTTLFSYNIFQLNQHIYKMTGDYLFPFKWFITFIAEMQSP